MVTLYDMMRAQKSGTAIPLPTQNLSTRSRWVVNTMSQPLYYWERDLVPSVKDAG